MRRTTTFLCCFLAFSSVALAAAPKPGTYKRSGGDKSVSQLQFKLGSGKVKGFKGYTWETCNDGSGLRQTAFAVDRAMRVRGGKFSADEKVKDGGMTFRTIVKGRFTSSTAAAGTLRYYSVFAGSICDTYTLKWKAKRG